MENVKKSGSSKSNRKWMNELNRSSSSSSSASSDSGSDSDSSSRSSSSSSSNSNSDSNGRATTKTKSSNSRAKNRETLPETVKEIKTHVCGSWEWCVGRLEEMSTKAIKIAVTEAGKGEVYDAAFTLRSAILLTKRSRVFKDPRAKIILSSLRYALEGVDRSIYRMERSSSSRKRARSRSSSHQSSQGYQDPPQSGYKSHFFRVPYYNRPVREEKEIHRRLRIEPLPVLPDLIPWTLTFDSNRLPSLTLITLTGESTCPVPGSKDREITPPPPGT